ncbi:uncharacterized protein PgNI_02134, partial [Pyricularia grisea]|uniref:Tyrosinase copper-binding domain-containing protein n=1 Tax=Pyricularia grisea TaxID=148305 RepID=A0A6P8BJE5_PYRGI
RCYIARLGESSATPLERRAAYYKCCFRNRNYPFVVVDQLEEETMPKVGEWVAGKRNSNGFTLKGAVVWRRMFPGLLTHFEDFVAFHMTQAGPVHGRTSRLDEDKFVCPLQLFYLSPTTQYINYNRYAEHQINSPKFNGIKSSIGQQGDPNNYSVLKGFHVPYNLIQPGGGETVSRMGPLKTTVINGIPRNPYADGLGSNPRCLWRDVSHNPALGARANYSNSFIAEYPHVNNFYYRTILIHRLHIAGHFFIGSDPSGNFYVSPGGLVFYFHRGALDWLW